MIHKLWQDRKVFVTGHTGFMGGWLCERLIGLGARVTGYALAPSTAPNLFEAIDLNSRMTSIIGDVRDGARLTETIARAQPEVVFHLAAQPLVRQAYHEPIETFSTNVMGTVNLLEAMRSIDTVSAAVIVTTDKVYENREWVWGYRETDTLGGFEPYGVSKACAELAVDAYARTYFTLNGPAIATVRAGNIIGGGDWAPDRLVPDAIRAFTKGETLCIRHPEAIRPWQHVLEPVDGMINLSARLMTEADSYSGPWNLGPAEEDACPVGWIADRLTKAWGSSAKWSAVPSTGPHEANLLTLSSAKARTALGWACRWNADTTVTHTAEWYRAFYQGADMASFTREQINDYFEGDYRGEFQRQENEKTRQAVA